MMRMNERQLRERLRSVLSNITQEKTEEAIALVLSIGITEAKSLAPMEYGTLINSAFRRIIPKGRSVIGVAGFAVHYAIYLHESETWNNKPPEDKDGPAWNPRGEPKFLEKGFTSDKQIRLMRRSLSTVYRS